MKRIERVVVDECIGQTSALPGQLRSRLGDQPIKFVFLATEHPGIPDIETIERMASRLLTAVSHPKAASCVKGRFFDRLDAKLNPLARFDSNELVSIDLQAMATALFRGQKETVRGQTCAPRPKA